jgi:hypothetical protein
VDGEDIGDDLKRFVVENINSVEQLEVLLLLYRAPDRWWTAEQVTAEIRTSLASARKRLDDLCSRNLLDVKLVQDVLFQYRPPNSEVARLVEKLAELYRQRMFGFIDLIYDRRRDAVRDLAEAFRIKKGEDDG